MPALSDHLKAMGVKIGAQDLPKPKPANPNTIEMVLGGHAVETHFGDTFLVEEFYPLDHQVGERPLGVSASLDGLSAWCGDARIAGLPIEAFAFLDTETTGLSGGTGTYAFLIGVARFEAENGLGNGLGRLHLMQIFMRDPLEEPAQLAALEQFLAPCQAIVTFNGKSFDLPLLNTRFRTHGWKSPFKDQPHVDLLHLARRLWKDRLPSRTLGNLEVQVLKTHRSEEDIPGWIIPQMYFEYLRSADARPLKGVFYHNAMDVVSLAALFQHTAAMLTDPLHHPIQHGVDIVALAKLFEDLGQIETATGLYLRGLQEDLPEPNLLQAVHRLAMINKRQNNLERTIELLEQAAQHRMLDAYVELAKLYEHRYKDYERAIHWAEAALPLLPVVCQSHFEQQQWRAGLEHRLERLRNRQR